MNELDHAPVIEWVTLTRRTNDPKLAWFEAYLTVLGIPHKRDGRSFHAPILKVEAAQYNEAWSIVEVWDDLPDDHPWFAMYHPRDIVDPDDPEEDQIAYWRRAGLDHKGLP